MYYARIIIIRRSFSGIIHTIIGIDVCWKLYIQPAVESDSADGESMCMYKSVKKKILYRDTLNSYHSTILYQQYIGKTTKYAFLLLKLKESILDLKAF